MYYIYIYTAMLLYSIRIKFRFSTAPILSSFDQIWILIEYFLRFPKGYTPEN